MPATSSAGQVSLLDTATDAVQIVLNVPMQTTVGSLKKAVVEKLGRGRAKDLRICFKVGGTFADYLDSEKVFSRKKRVFYSIGLDFSADAGGTAAKESAPDDTGTGETLQQKSPEGRETGAAAAEEATTQRERIPSVGDVAAATGASDQPSAAEASASSESSGLTASLLLRRRQENESGDVSAPSTPSGARKRLGALTVSTKTSMVDMFEPASPRGRSQNEPSSPHATGSPKKRGEMSFSPSRNFSPPRRPAGTDSPEGRGQESSLVTGAKPSTSGRKRIGAKIPGAAVSEDISPLKARGRAFDDFNALDKVAEPRSPRSRSPKSPKSPKVVTFEGSGPSAASSGSQSKATAEAQSTPTAEAASSAADIEPQHEETPSPSCPRSADDQLFDFESLTDEVGATSSTWTVTLSSRLSSAASLRQYGCAAEEMGRDSARIAIISNGSLGDVQPLVALALALERCRHNVCLFVPVNLVRDCTKHGINAVAVFGHTQECIRRMGGMESSGRDRDKWIQQLRRSKQELDKWFKENPDACVNVSDALSDFDPEVMVFGSQCEGPVIRQEKKSGVPAIPMIFNRLDLQTHDYMSMKPPRPMLYAVGEEFDPEPLGPSRWAKRVGSLFIKDAMLLPEMEDLRLFLEAGPAPVAMGWGSMQPARLTPTMLLGRCIRALLLCKMRGVIIGGWFGLHEVGKKLITEKTLEGFQDARQLAAYAESNICFVATAPHEWLLPKCCCMVHHGGAGTVQAALRAGCPQVITPIWHDQYDSALRIADMKAGYGFKRLLPEVNENNFASAIRHALNCKLKAVSDDECEERADRAAAIIDLFLKTDVKTGAWSNQFRALPTQLRRNELR